MTRVEKGVEFKGDSYSNGYKDNNDYLGKLKAYCCDCKRDKRDKKRDRFLDSQEQY